MGFCFSCPDTFDSHHSGHSKHHHKHHLNHHNKSSFYNTNYGSLKPTYGNSYVVPTPPANPPPFNPEYKFINCTFCSGTKNMKCQYCNEKGQFWNGLNFVSCSNCGGLSKLNCSYC